MRHTIFLVIVVIIVGGGEEGECALSQLELQIKRNVQSERSRSVGSGCKAGPD